jgi:hypothetical protein
MHAYRRDPPHSFSQMQRDTVWCISTVLGRPIKNRGIRLIVTVPYKQYPLSLRLHVDILLITVQLHVTITPLTSYCGTMNLLLRHLTRGQIQGPDPIHTCYGVEPYKIHGPRRPSPQDRPWCSYRCNGVGPTLLLVCGEVHG